jgi:hypothetical protein
MIKFLFSLLLLVLTVSVSGQFTAPLTSGTLPNGWSQTDVTFTISSTGYANFTTSAAILTSPILTVSAGAQITFEVAKFGAGTDGPLTVDVSNDGGATWTAQTFTSPTPTSATYVTSGPTALTVTGSNIRVRWTRSASPQSAKRLRMVSITNALPIELNSFIVKATPKDVNVNWQTATEKNNDYFAIERSSDGRTFAPIGEVKGAGTTLTPQNYTYTDEKPLRGINFYRLKQVDFDGQFSYSPVVSVVFGKVGNVVLYPTPTKSTMNVRLEEAFQTEASWQVIDLVGRVITAGIFPAEQTDMQIPVGTLSEGNYVLRITAGQEVITQKFRKIEQ